MLSLFKQSLFVILSVLSLHLKLYSYKSLMSTLTTTVAPMETDMQEEKCFAEQLCVKPPSFSQDCEETIKSLCLQQHGRGFSSCEVQWMQLNSNIPRRCVLEILTRLGLRVTAMSEFGFRVTWVKQEEEAFSSMDG